jgi:tetratricopeptide (TPR) repeat protein
MKFCVHGFRIVAISLAAASLGAVWLGAVWPAAASTPLARQPLAEINAHLQAGEADKALDLIASLPQGGSNIAQAKFLECRVRYALEQWNAAADACARAVKLDGKNSNYHMWYGRALGGRANSASFLSAFSLGKQVHEQFETAVELDPRNAEALSDLGSFDVDAPSIVGGGLDKAEQVASQLEKIDQARAHQLRAEMASHRKDYATEEKELKAAVAASAHPALQLTVLANFYRHRQRWDEMDAAVRSAQSAAAKDRTAGVALYDGAGVLYEARRDSVLAAKMLQDYLASSSKTDEAPAFVAYSRLAELQRQLGNSAEAQRDVAAAQALAHEYRPKEAKH